METAHSSSRWPASFAAVLSILMLAAFAALARADDLLQLPADPKLDVTCPLRLETSNRAVRLQIINAARVAQYGAFKPPAGRSLLLLSTEWENAIPLKAVAEQKLATAYKIPNLADHLYLVADGHQLLRLDPATGRLPGHIPVNDFTIAKLGDRLTGNLLFNVPDGPIGSIELHFYDFAHGHMSLVLGPPVAPAKPLAPPIANEVISGAAYGIEKLPELKGHKLSPGMNFVRVDFCATSKFSTDADATAFDPKAKPGDKIKIGTVADWTDAMKYATLVVDGEYGYVPIADASTLGAAPRFLPDVPTGGYLTFMAPANATSLELRCDFPNAKTSDGKLMRPKGLTLPIEGTRPKLPEITPVASIDDDIFQVQIGKEQALDQFAGTPAGANKKFVLLDVTVNNRHKDGEFFQATQQLHFVAANGSQQNMHAAGLAGPHPPTDLVWVPPGERRSYQAVFLAASADLAKPRLAYRGVSKAQIVELPTMQP